MRDAEVQTTSSLTGCMDASNTAAPTKHVLSLLRAKSSDDGAPPKR